LQICSLNGVFVSAIAPATPNTTTAGTGFDVLKSSEPSKAATRPDGPFPRKIDLDPMPVLRRALALETSATLRGPLFHQIADLATQATSSPRKRAHLLMYNGPADSVQRLVIVLQPNTYVRPHHHSRQWEMLVLQQGRGNLVIFDNNARLVDRIELSPSASVIQIPTGVWHGFVVLEPNTAVLEIKPLRTNLRIGRRRKST
jgi:cupin fold WbuC family metalloprotein